MTLRRETRDSLAGIEREWDALVDLAPVPSPFLRAWWLERVAGPTPRFVVVLDGEELVGGGAFDGDSVLGTPRLRFIGFELGADHLDIVARPDRVDAVVEEVRDELTRDSLIVDLIGLAANARVARALEGWGTCEVFDHASITPLPTTFDEYLQQRPGELRSLVERPWRRLQREGVEHQVVGPDSCEPALRSLRRLHAAQFGDRSHFLPHFDRFAGAVEAGVARGEMVIHQLAVDDTVIAINVFFEVARRASFYQGARDSDRRWRGAGTVLMARAIEHACARGCDELDLLRGAESYKSLWADTSRPVLRCMGARGTRARLALAMLPVARRARALVRRATRFGR